jgi:hypothetical protein
LRSPKVVRNGGDRNIISRRRCCLPDAGLSPSKCCPHSNLPMTRRAALLGFDIGLM